MLELKIITCKQNKIMKTNLLIAIESLVKLPVVNIKSHYKSINRINSVGDALEYYVKDLFCGSLSENNIDKKNVIYEKNFSCFGNQNHPPDFVIKNGDAIEVKKIEGFKSALALNSSPPKNKLRSDDIRITADCKKADGGNWKEKETFYVIEQVKGIIAKKIQLLNASIDTY